MDVHVADADMPPFERKTYGEVRRTGTFPTPPLLLMMSTLYSIRSIRLATSQRLCPSLSFWQVSFSSQIAQAHM